MKAEQTLYEQLAEIIGKDGALNLCEQYGGQTIYIGKNLHQSTELKEHWETYFGGIAVEKLTERFGGRRVYIPCAPDFLLEQRNHVIWERLRQGDSPSEIARDYRLTERRVRVISSLHIGQEV